MCPYREGMTFEEMVAERNREFDERHAAGVPPAASGDDPPPELAGSGFMVCEAAALPWGVSAERGTDYASGVQHLLTRIWYVMYTLGEQQLEIVRLRDNTRQMLAGLATA